MKRSNQLLVALFCITLYACQSKPSFGIKEVSWLQGSWRLLDGSGIESWKLNGDQLDGTVFSNKDKAYTETLRIYPGKDNNLIYEATVKNQNGGKPISFGLLYRSLDSLQFVNMNHDFPNYIEYKKVNDTVVFCNAYGMQKSGYSFLMTKIQMSE